MNAMEELLKDSAENIVENNLEGINTDEVELIPCNMNVIIKPYPVNPYRKIDTTSSGIIVGVESDKTYKSNETGEIEQNLQILHCGRVVAKGSKCENVEIGDDVYYTTYSMVPLPFRKMGYVVVGENLLVCRVIKK